MPLRVEVLTEKEGWVAMADFFHVDNEVKGFSQFVRNGQGDIWEFKKGENDSQTVIEHLVFQLKDFNKNSFVSKEEVVLEEGQTYIMELSSGNILSHRFTQVSVKS